MWAALRLRLLEARRRGGPLLIGLAVAAVGLTALVGGDTADGRYGLASDLAATLGYLAAVFVGAFPLAVDRERRRSYLPGASPVSPLAWALGNAAGAACVAALGAFALFAAAAAGSALSGGVDTFAVTRVGGFGTQRLPVDITDVPADARQIRLVTRTALRVEETVGTEEAARITVNGAPYDVHWNQTLFVPVRPPRIALRNVSDHHEVGVVKEEIRILGAERSFLLNALAAAVAPALGAAALAAFSVAAGAHLTGSVAALLAVLVLLLAALKGFLLETFEHQGSVRLAEAHGHVHVHGPEPHGGAAHGAAKAVVKSVLAVVPDVAALDRTGRVALGEWTGLRRSGRAALLLAGALVLAAALGGLGVFLRRTP